MLFNETNVKGNTSHELFTYMSRTSLQLLIIDETQLIEYNYTLPKKIAADLSLHNGMCNLATKIRTSI